MCPDARVLTLLDALVNVVHVMGMRQYRLPVAVGTALHQLVSLPSWHVGVRCPHWEASPVALMIHLSMQLALAHIASYTKKSRKMVVSVKFLRKQVLVARLAHQEWVLGYHP